MQRMEPDGGTQETEVAKPPKDRSEFAQDLEVVGRVAGPFVSQIIKSQEESERRRFETEQLRIRESSETERQRIAAFQKSSELQYHASVDVTESDAKERLRGDVIVGVLGLVVFGAGFAFLFGGHTQEAYLCISNSAVGMLGYFAGKSRGKREPAEPVGGVAA